MAMIGAIDEEVRKEIKAYLRENYPALYHKAYSDPEARQTLKELISTTHRNVLDTEEKVDAVLKLLVGLSFIEDLKEDERITDIGYDGQKLIIEGNGIEKHAVEGIPEEEILKIIAKFQNTTGRELTPTDPILNTSRDYLRLNAVHKEVAIDGTTMAIRVSRPRMALTEENFESFAPAYILDFFKAAIKTRSSILIAGDPGTGKTEFQKLLMSLIPFEERIDLIESTKDIYAKELFPEKDIFYWLSNENASIEDLISYAVTRTNTIWAIVGEILGREVYQMYIGLLTGLKFLTTLHAVDARAIPKRLMSMAKMGYDFDEKAFLDDVYSYVHFGVYIKKRKGVRYLSEIVEFHGDHSATTVFKQVETEKGLMPVNGKISDDFFRSCIEFDADYQGLPENGSGWL